MARLAGQLHPQTVVIDLIFHQHNLERVLGGRLLFTIASDEWGGRQTFYLPTPYIFMAPLQWLLNDELLTIRLFTVALDTLGVFLVYYLAKRAFGDGRAGLLAAGLLVTLSAGHCCPSRGASRPTCSASSGGWPRSPSRWARSSA